MLEFDFVGYGSAPDHQMIKIQKSEARSVWLASKPIVLSLIQVVPVRPKSSQVVPGPPRLCCSSQFVPGRPRSSHVVEGRPRFSQVVRMTTMFQCESLVGMLSSGKVLVRAL